MITRQAGDGKRLSRNHAAYYLLACMHARQHEQPVQARNGFQPRMVSLITAANCCFTREDRRRGCLSMPEVLVFWSCASLRGREDDKGSVSTKVLFSLESRVEVSSMGKGRGWEVHV